MPNDTNSPKNPTLNEKHIVIIWASCVSPNSLYFKNDVPLFIYISGFVTSMGDFDSQIRKKTEKQDVPTVDGYQIVNCWWKINMVHLNMAPNPKAPAAHFSCTLWKPFMELVYCIPLDIGIVLHLLSLLQLANPWEKLHFWGVSGAC